MQRCCGCVIRIVLVIVYFINYFYCFFMSLFACSKCPFIKVEYGDFEYWQFDKNKFVHSMEKVKGFIRCFKNN